MRKSLPLYALGHFAVDFLCAWLMFGRMSGSAHWPELALIYNFCAFAMQMPLGILADRLDRNRPFALGGAGLVFLAAVPAGNWWTAVLAGLGNALYHVGGGRHTMLEETGYGPLGVFVAPGAVGIFLGSSLRGSNFAGWLAAALLVLCAIALPFCPGEKAAVPCSVKPKNLWRVAVLFAVVLLRSLVGMTALAPWKTGLWILLGAVLGAAGKTLGGITADRLGSKLTGTVSLVLASCLFLLPGSPVCGVLAGLLFQMSMPITLGDARKLLPGNEGFSFGLLTFALFLGFLPAQHGMILGSWQAALLAALSGLGLLLASKRRAPCTT